MRVTFDTNVINPLASPELYAGCPDMQSVDEIRSKIQSGSIRGFVSEASMSLESLPRDERIDNFLRQWAGRARPIVLPKPSQERVDVFNRAFKMGIRVLHAPRIALGSMIEFSDEYWAEDVLYSQDERLGRFFAYIRAQPNTGSSEIRLLGAKLVLLHKLPTGHLQHLAQLQSWPKPEELMWMQGLLAEYDSPKMFSSKKQFLNKYRDLVAEWFDIDLQASHYAYGNDYLCTFDSASGAGAGSVMHKSRISGNEKAFGIKVMSPAELLSACANAT